ncbi:unnamed protein product [Cochlearia groenlandica]
MAKIKPQALLQQSKKKKGPSRISITNIIIYSLALLLVVFVLFSAYRRWTHRSEIPTHNGRSVLEDAAFPGMKSSNVPRFATLDTGKGSMTIELFKDTAPDVVDQFMKLCQDGYFKGFLFRRVVKGSVIQAGESSEFESVKDWALERKNLDTSVKQEEEFVLGSPKAKNEKGGFEFYIVSSRIKDLKEKLRVFGRVTKGQDVVKEIQEVETDEQFQPKSPIEIISVTLLQDM